MSCKVFIEQHLENYLKQLSIGHKQEYTVGVVIGQVICDNYYVVHLARKIENTLHCMDVLAHDGNDERILLESEIFYSQLLSIIDLLPGGSYVLGIFFIAPQNISFQPLNIDFYEFDRQLKRKLNNRNILCNDDKTWDYLLLKYSFIDEKLFCYTVDFKRSRSPKVANFKSIGYVFEPLDNDWVTLVGTFNFGSLSWLNVAGLPRHLLSVHSHLLRNTSLIQDAFFDEFRSILNGSVLTFNGCVCDENKILKDFEYHTIKGVSNNVVNIEFFNKVDLGNECKNAFLLVENGKRRFNMSGLCSIFVPFNRNGSVKDAIKAIYEDAIYTFTNRLTEFCRLIPNMSDEKANVVVKFPRRILILKAEGSKFPFSDYKYPDYIQWKSFQNNSYVDRFILDLPKKKLIYYELEKE